MANGSQIKQHVDILTQIARGHWPRWLDTRGRDDGPVEGILSYLQFIENKTHSITNVLMKVLVELQEEYEPLSRLLSALTQAAPEIGSRANYSEVLAPILREPHRFHGRHGEGGDLLLQACKARIEAGWDATLELFLASLPATADGAKLRLLALRRHQPNLLLAALVRDADLLLGDLLDEQTLRSTLLLFLSGATGADRARQMRLMLKAGEVPNRMRQLWRTTLEELGFLRWSDPGKPSVRSLPRFGKNGPARKKAA